MSKFRDLCVSLLGVVVVWQLIVWATGVPRYILPGPILVAQALIENRALIMEHAWVTFAEVLLGLIIGSLLGAVTALHLMQSALARRFVLPVMVFSQAVPVFALAPLLTLWLGYGLWSKIAMATLIIYFPVAATFYDGLQNTSRSLLDLAASMRATPLSTLLRIRLPAAVPSFASGLKLAAVYAPIGAIIGEWVGASQGLGYLMLLANGRVKIDLMFAALIVLATFTLLLHASISKVARIATDWAHGTDSTARP